MKFFTINELIKSETAMSRGINNAPDMVSLTRLVELIEVVLDPLREAWGKPIYVTSGFRSEALNNVVGGSKTSHHLKGQAADITTGNKADNKELFNLVRSLELPFTQLIDEKNYSWLHVSYDKENVKRQILHLK